MARSRASPAQQAAVVSAIRRKRSRRNRQGSIRVPWWSGQSPSRQGIAPHGRRARPDAEKEIAEPLPLHAFGKGAPVGAAFQPLRPADGPEVFLLHGFAKIRIQQQFVSAQAGCKAVIRLAGLHCFHKKHILKLDKRRSLPKRIKERNRA